MTNCTATEYQPNAQTPSKLTVHAKSNGFFGQSPQKYIAYANLIILSPQYEQRGLHFMVQEHCIQFDGLGKRLKHSVAARF